MRHLIALGLSCCVVGSVAAQTEVIIRRPGQKDQVIRVDSAHATARAQELAKTVQGEVLERRNVELKNRLEDRVQLDRSMQNRVKLLQRDLGRNSARFDSAANVLALRSENFADVEKARTALQRSFADMKVAFRQPHIGVGVDTRPRDTDRYGAYVQSVTPGSPADRAGILSGDIITKVAGKSLTEKGKDDGDDTTPGLRLISIITKLPAGKPVDVELRRGTQNRSLKVTPVEDDMPTMARVMPEQFSGKLTYALPREMGVESPRAVEMAAPAFSVFGNNGGYFYSFGGNGLFADLELAPLNEKLGSYFGTSEGVLVIGTTPDRAMFSRSIRLDSSARSAAVAGGRGGFATGRRIDGEPARAGAVGGGRGRVDTNVVYIDGVPAAPTVTRKAVTLGLEPGDVVVSVDGRKVTTPAQLMRIVGTYERGEEFKLQIMRQKRAETITAKMP